MRRDRARVVAVAAPARARLDALAEIGVHRRRRRARRLALTDADKEGRDLVVTGCATSGCGSTSTASATSSAPGRPTATEPPVLTGSHIDTRRAPAASTTATSACWPASRSIETVITARRRARPPARGRRSSPTRRAAASRPTCSAASCTSAGSPLEEALDTRRPSTARWLGDELERIGYVGPDAVPGPAARTPSSSCTSSRARCSRPRAITIGAVTGVQGISWQELTVTGQSNHAGTTPMDLRHDAGLRRRLDRHVRPGRWPTELGPPQVGDRRPDRAPPQPRQRGGGPGHAHRRPAQHRRRRAPARPRPRLAAHCDELAATEGVTIDGADPGPLRAGRLRRRPWSTWSSASPPRTGHSRAAHAVGRRPRRADARPRVPDRDDLRAERRRHQPQPGRAHRRPPTSRPAPTCCSHVLLELAAAGPDAVDRERWQRRRPSWSSPPRRWGPIAARPTPRAEVVERLIALLREAAAPRRRAGGVPRAGAHHVLPPLVIDDADELDAYFETEMPGPDDQAAVRRGGPARRRLPARLRRAHRPTATATTPPVLVDARRHDRRPLPQGPPARPRGARAVAAVPAPRAALLRARARGLRTSTRRSAASSARRSATTAAGPRPTGCSASRASSWC